MRYKYIELVGYAGIFNGMGLNQINIDFTKCVSNKIIIRGKNGSGKSTIINAINPNPESNDLFVPTMEARKTLGLINNGIEYIIRYIHPLNNNGTRGTTKGYISKFINGAMVELNPNGNISSCKDIIYEEFNLDSNYVTLSKLGSENRGLVDSRPAERKKLLNGIINSLEVYNGIYKNLSKKSSIYKTSINSLVYKIDSIGNEDAVKANLDSIEKQISSLEKEKSNTIEAVAAIKLKISDYERILQESAYDDIVSELKTITKDIEVNESKVNDQLETLHIDILKIDEFIKYLEDQASEIKTNLAIYNSKIPELLARREADYKDLQEKSERLNSLKSEFNYIDINEAIKKCKSIVESHKAIFDHIGITSIDLITKSEYDAAMNAFGYLLNQSKSLLSTYDIEDVAYVVNNISTIHSFISEATNLEKSNDKLLQERDILNRNITIYQTKREIASELVNRPKKCKIDDCPYIKSAFEADRDYPESKFNSMAIRLKEIEDVISKNNYIINKAKLYNNILIRINEMQRELDSKIEFMLKLPIDRNFKYTFFDRLINLDPFNDIAELYSYVDHANILDEYKTANEQLKIYETEYKVYESKNKIIDSMIDSINDLTLSTNHMAEEIDRINLDIVSNEQTLEELNKTILTVKGIKDKIELFIKPMKVRQTELIDIKSKLEIHTSAIQDLKIQLDGVNINLGQVESELRTLGNERDKLKHQLTLLDEYRNDLITYNDKYVKLEKIRYYSSPSTGIQTLFIEIYMNKIIMVANELLSLLFDGEFSLQPFIVNESEFRIPCIGDGLMHDDISSMSTAQKCMISMILSFSLLQQSATNYNIISLDEIDGGLDIVNRGLFINLLDRLMNMLKCEQCFIVSHNDELSTTAADLILLKNNSNQVYQGNIIWKY